MKTFKQADTEVSIGYREGHNVLMSTAVPADHRMIHVLIDPEQAVEIGQALIDAAWKVKEGDSTGRTAYSQV